MLPKSLPCMATAMWVALPVELEDMQPVFHHIPAAELPQWNDGAAKFVLVAGTGYGKKSPVPVHSELFMVDVQVEKDYELDISGNLSGEVGITVVKGSVIACGDRVEAGNMLVSKVADACKLTVVAGSHVLLFGGEPFPEERHIYWNFVSHSKERIEKAKSAWKDKTFPMMENDDTYVSLPES